MHEHAQKGTLTRGADGALYLLSPGSCVRVQESRGGSSKRHLEADEASGSKYGKAAGWHSAFGDQASARMVIDPGDQASARMVIDPGDQLSARMVIDPGDQASARMVIDPGDQASARMVIEPGDQASARMVIDPGDQASARMVIDPGESLVN